MTAPCKDCPTRYVGCHSECKAYQAYRAEHETHYKLRKDLMQLECDAVMRHEKWVRRRRRK